VTTRDSRMQHHFITSFYPRNEFAHFANDACNVAAEYVRQRNIDTRQSTAHKNIEMIQCTGFNFDENLIGTQLRLRDVCVLKHVRSAVLSEGDGFHSVGL